MSTPKSFLSILLICGLALLAACSDDDGVRPLSRADIHGLVLKDGHPVRDATVYLAREPGFPPMLAPVVFDSTVTDSDGLYEFDHLDPDLYRTYAAVWGEKDYVQVSSYTGVLDLTGGNLPDKSAPLTADLDLRDMEFEGVVTGDVWMQTETEAPVDSALVTVLRYVSDGLHPSGEAWSDAGGDFAVTEVQTGNYTAYAWKEFLGEAPFPVYMSGETPAFFSDGKGTVVLPRLWLFEAFVEKPAIYIEPEKAGIFDVDLVLDHRTRLTRSEPEYGDGWEVEVAADGRIDGRWDYLFYEVAISAWPRLQRGWCVARDDLARALADIGRDFGLNENELEDFLGYWSTRLPRYPWYLVKPVAGSDLDVWVALRVRPEPDTVLRFWLFFQGADAPVDLEPPPVLRVGRTGTTVVEWGGVILPTRGF